MSTETSGEIYSKEESITFNNLNRYLKIAFKRKKLLSLFIIFGLIGGLTSSFVKSNKYKGEFTLVTSDLIRSKSGSQLLSTILENVNSEDLKVLKRANKVDYDNFYEWVANKKVFVSLIGSDDFLEPIYIESIKKSNLNPKDISFSDWKKYIQITFIKSTSNLNIIFTSQNEELVKNSLNNSFKKITKLPNELKNKQYSKQLNNIENSIYFLKNQISEAELLNYPISLERKLLKELENNLIITKLNAQRSFEPFLVLSKPKVKLISKTQFLKINIILFCFISLILGLITANLMERKN